MKNIFNIKKREYKIENTSFFFIGIGILSLLNLIVTVLSSEAFYDRVLVINNIIWYFTKSDNDVNYIGLTTIMIVISIFFFIGFLVRKGSKSVVIFGLVLYSIDLALFFVFYEFEFSLLTLHFIFLYKILITLLECLRAEKKKSKEKKMETEII